MHRPPSSVSSPCGIMACILTGWCSTPKHYTLSPPASSLASSPLSSSLPPEEEKEESAYSPWMRMPLGHDQRREKSAAADPRAPSKGTLKSIGTIRFHRRRVESCRGALTVHTTWRVFPPLDAALNSPPSNPFPSLLLLLLLLFLLAPFSWSCSSFLIPLRSFLLLLLLLLFFLLEKERKQFRRYAKNGTSLHCTARREIESSYPIDADAKAEKTTTTTTAVAIVCCFIYDPWPLMCCWLCAPLLRPVLLFCCAYDIRHQTTKEKE